MQLGNSNGLALTFGRIRTRTGVIPSWLIQRVGAPLSAVRNLRICLARLHAEQETLDLVLKQLQRGELLRTANQADVDKLDDYFNRKTHLINRAHLDSIEQSSILEALDAAEKVTPPSSRHNLADRYEGARRQVWRKIEDYQVRRAAVRVVPVVNVSAGGTYVEKNVTVNQSGTGNIINIAEFMSNVTNTVNANLQAAPVSEDISKLVKQLTADIDKISPNIDPDKTQEMGRSLETLTKEMASDKPRKAWYELSLKGIKEAAEAVGEIAAPVVSTVGKLLPLLLGAV